MRQPTALDILKAARAKIAQPKDWAKFKRTRRANFDSCCAAEAIEEAIQGDRLDERRRAFRALKNAAGIDGWITEWNDAPERTHSEVIAAFNLAIATLRLY